MKVRIGGVPEHFNLAWHLAIEQGHFEAAGLTVEWKDVPGGTGAMCKALREDELDIAIALTEGMVSDILQGNPSKIVQFYVNSPLAWGIYVNSASPIQSIDQMPGHQYAISRFKSGSHLMAYVNADQHKLDISEDDFVVVGNLDGARKALKENTAQLFMWEKFTTKPFVDSGEFRMIGECRTPWPCFVIAARNEFIEKYPQQLVELLNIINLSCLVLKNNSDAPKLISERYHIREEDAMLWFKELEYACQPEINNELLQRILGELFKLNIIQRIPEATEICYEENLEPSE
jgi:ABC-type nitrate/sulfonate/bicarbonate transport system substrate-binding protein